jgi:hypothetical protein
MGESVVVRGPAVISLYEGEKSEGVKDGVLLSKSQYIFVQATEDYEERKAGNLYRIVGPCLYFPHRFEKMIGNKREAINSMKIFTNLIIL